MGVDYRAIQVESANPSLSPKGIYETLAGHATRQKTYCFVTKCFMSKNLAQNVVFPWRTFAADLVALYSLHWREIVEDYLHRLVVTKLTPI